MAMHRETRQENMVNLKVFPIFSPIISATGRLNCTDRPMSPFRSFSMYITYWMYQGRSSPSSVFNFSTFSTLTVSLLNIRLIESPGAKETSAKTMKEIPTRTGIVVRILRARYLPIHHLQARGPAPGCGGNPESSQWKV
ncbi:hypothetical protein TRIP_E30021 [uncultured Spirochaetota bacterium]|nr:hypothetical protein TRIP_E30021 [uncultured Spirochaetota bacterium]